jgi:maltose alpha-D-glucosyltransferase / alpha-amylase
MRAEMDARYKNRLFLAEANEWPEDLLPYFGAGDECHMAFHFPLMPRIYMAVAQEDRHPIVDIIHQTPEIPDTCQWAIFLRNHDELTLEMVTDRERDYMYQTYGNDPRMRVNVGIRRRLAPMMENDRPRIELLNSLLMSMPGTPIVYYGDEIGMGDNIFLGDRDAVRTPMQWTSDRNAGFSRAEPARLYLPPIMDPVYGYESVNVEAQSRSPGSLLSWMKRIIAVRKAHKAFGRGTMEFLHPGNRKVLGYLREYEDQAILCVANLSRSAQPVELDLSRFRGRVPVELLGGSSFPPLGDLPYLLTLPGHSFYWFRLTKDAEPPVWHRETPRLVELPVLVLPAGGTRRAGDHRITQLYLPARQLARLEREALPSFLGARRWFATDEDDVYRAEITTQTGFGPDRLLTLLRVHAREGLPGTSGTSEPQLYFLPLSAGWEAVAGAAGDPALMPHAVARLRQRARMGALYDALVDEGFCREVVAAVGEGRTLEMGEGRLLFSRTGAFEELLGDEPAGSLSVRRAEAEGTNSLVVLGERLVLKVYRRLLKGPNPEPEVGRYLTEQVRFQSTPPLAGAVEYETASGERITLALLQGFVENQGEGQSYTRELLARYFENHLVTAWSLEDQERTETEESAAEGAFFAGFVRTLGLRTGELHAAFAAPTNDGAFSREPAPPEEVAGWAEEVGETLGRTLEELRKRREDLAGDARPDADRLLALRDEAYRRVGAVAGGGFGVVKTRYHGDYRLGKVLVVGNDFQIIDFEGHPTRPLSERRGKHSPLRDVAGMLLSLEGAARSALSSLGAERAERLETLEPLARLWRECAREGFLEGYVEGARAAASYPEREEQVRALVELFELEKALHEIHRELEHTTDRAADPIRVLIELLER